MSKFFQQTKHSILDTHKEGRDLPKVTDVVASFYKHYQELYDKQIESGRPRLTSANNTIQSRLSFMKTQLVYAGVDKKWCSGLKLYKRDQLALDIEKTERVQDMSSRLPPLDMDLMVKKARYCLATSVAPCDVLVALALITGRRWGELLVGIKIDKSPKGPHWAKISGMSKQRGGNRTIEVPIFADVTMVNIGLTFVRSWLPLASLSRASIYAHDVIKSCKRVFPGVSIPHHLRKIYAHVCYVYFNPEHDGIALVASRVLGHKSLGSTVITYLGGYHNKGENLLKFPDNANQELKK